MDFEQIPINLMAFIIIVVVEVTMVVMAMIIVMVVMIVIVLMQVIIVETAIILFIFIIVIIKLRMDQYFSFITSFQVSSYFSSFLFINHSFQHHVIASSYSLENFYPYFSLYCSSMPFNQVTNFQTNIYHIFELLKLLLKLWIINIWLFIYLRLLRRRLLRWWRWFRYRCFFHNYSLFFLLFWFIFEFSRVCIH